jgi:hypothetical protein
MSYRIKPLGDYSKTHNELVLTKISLLQQYKMFTNGGTCLFDIVHSALWGSEYPVCTPDAQVLFLNGARMLHAQRSAVQALPSGV